MESSAQDGKGANYFSIVGIILAVVGLFVPNMMIGVIMELVAIALGIIGIRQTHGKNKTMLALSIVSIVIGVLAILAIALMLAGVTQA